MTSIILTNVLAVAIGFAVLVRMLYSWMMPKPIPNIPHNPITSVWGDNPAIAEYSKEGKFTMEYVDDMARKHGGIPQMLVGHQAMVIITDIREAERLLLDSKVAEQAKRVAGVSPNSQVALPTDDAWKRHRRLAGPSMSKRYLQRMTSRICAGATDLVKLWKAKMSIAGSCAFDASLDIQLSTMDNMGDITLGSSFGCIKSAQAALPVNGIQLSNCVVEFPPPNLPPSYAALGAMGKSIEAAMNAPFPSFYAQMIKNAIEESRARESTVGTREVGLATDADCVVDMITQREVREGAEAFGNEAIHDELMSFIFAGLDTTTSILRWLIKHLSANPEVQHRLHNEVCGVFGQEEDSDLDDSWDFNLLDDSDRLPLLEAVVAETLRCAGVGAQIARELLQDENILGRLVPKGTDVIFATTLMSKDIAEWGPDADEW